MFKIKNEIKEENDLKIREDCRSTADLDKKFKEFPARFHDEDSGSSSSSESEDQGQEKVFHSSDGGSSSSCSSDSSSSSDDSSSSSSSEDSVERDFQAEPKLYSLSSFIVFS